MTPYPTSVQAPGYAYQCCECKVFYGPDGLPLAVAPIWNILKVSHGYCAACFAKVQKSIPAPSPAASLPLPCLATLGDADSSAEFTANGGSGNGLPFPL